MKRRRLVSKEPVMEMLDVNENGLRRLVKQREIPFYKVGGRLRFDLAEIDTWLDANRVGPVA